MPSPKASFCIATYKRPLLLKKQLELLITQTFKDFEVVVSDNDEEKSAEKVVQSMNDPRFKYFHNGGNIGMVKSFNKSIERSEGEYIVMVTDDDPIDSDMLTELFKVVDKYPSFGLYCACKRIGKDANCIEHYSSTDFTYQILHPGLTTGLLWSNCLLRREDVLKIGGMPDYGSPHLADHAMLALCSKFSGGVLINRVFSTLSTHAENFSKSNIKLYYVGCLGFYELMMNSFDRTVYIKGRENVLVIHLKKWFFATSFYLRRYYTFKNRNAAVLSDISVYSKKVLALTFMRRFIPWYIAKMIIFYLKYPILAFKEGKS